MRILLDESVPRHLKKDLQGHQVATVPEMGWRANQNGELLRLASREFDVFIVVDQNLEYQQNLTQYDLALILLIAPNNTYEMLSPLAPAILNALKTIQRGDFIKLSH